MTQTIVSVEAIVLTTPLLYANVHCSSNCYAHHSCINLYDSYWIKLVDTDISIFISRTTIELYIDIGASVLLTNKPQSYEFTSKPVRYVRFYLRSASKSVCSKAVIWENYPWHCRNYWYSMPPAESFTSCRLLP